MTINEGTLDRTVRIVVGLALIGVALGLYGPAYTSVWGWIGVLPLATGVVGWCPGYSLLGIKTCAS
jgi:Inner membrane protein YgaP-like, transmembrane domain